MPDDSLGHAGTLAHYEDAAYYEQRYGTQKDDLEYYEAVAKGRDRVLEYGVGNGRIAIPLARSGSRVTGVDRSRPMLADLRARLKREPAAVRARVRLRFGDMRRVRLGVRFPLVICPFNAVLHLYTRKDVEDWLACVASHLEPRGELVFDVNLPVPKDLARNPARAVPTAPFHHPSLGPVRYEEYFDFDPSTQILHVTMRFVTIEGGRSVTTPLAHRQFFPGELEALLHYAGFETTALYGDFERGPLQRSSDVMVFHARRRRAR